MPTLSSPSWFHPAVRTALFWVVALGMALLASTAVACPDWRQNGTQLSYSSDTLWTPRSHGVWAGGANNLMNCPQPGVGHVATRPDFTLRFTGNAVGRDLEFRVQGTCDTVLLVNDAAAQWHFNDDSDGVNPRIRIPAARDGVYDIWVGTYSPTPCQATLILETFAGAAPPPPPPPPVANCPNPQMTGQMLTHGAQSLWSPRSYSVVAGGNVNLSACPSVPGNGYVAQRQDFTLDFTENNAGRDLEFRVQGACDTVLLVRDPRGQWHFVDDADGTLHPRLRLSRAATGRYGIWVGTFGSATCQATLALETFGGAAPPPPPGDARPDPGNLMGYRAQVGQTFRFQVTGAATGSVWGSDVYTDDSSLARAAVHAGLLRVGQSGVIRVTILPGQQSYQGSTRNGVQSSNYGPWSGSFRFPDQRSSAGPGPGDGPTPGVAALVGNWSINANGEIGQLTLNWHPVTGWSGSIRFRGQSETLDSITFYEPNGLLEFIRPTPGVGQAYRGTLSGGTIRGLFNIRGGGFIYEWTATR